MPVVPQHVDPEYRHVAAVVSVRKKLAASRRLVTSPTPASDRYGVFRNTLPGHEDEPTQFTRALSALDIEPI